MGGKNDHAPIFLQSPYDDLEIVDTRPGQNGLGVTAGEGAGDLHEDATEMVINIFFQPGQKSGGGGWKSNGQVVRYQT